MGADRKTQSNSPQPKVSKTDFGQTSASSQEIESVAAIVAEAFACAKETGEPSDDEAFDRITATSDLLAGLQAPTLAGVVAKLRVWKLLTAEDAINPEVATVDERLLLSIVGDIERLNERV